MPASRSGNGRNARPCRRPRWVSGESALDLRAGPLSNRGRQGGVPMRRQRIDIASKWLLHHQAKGALLVGGLTSVRRYQPMPGEIVQSRKYPDGLLQVFLGTEAKPHHVL